MNRYLSIFCFLLLFQQGVPVVVSAQEHRLLFHSLGVNEGLSHSSAYSLYQDSRGFVWVGTAEGLNRYDGGEIRVYSPEYAKKDAEAGYIRNDILEDKEGNIWYVNFTGIYCWDKRKDALLEKSHFSLSRSTVVAGLGSNGDLWFFELTKGIVCYNIYTGKETLYRYPFKYEATKFRNAQVAYGEKQVWFSVYSNGDYYYFNKQSKEYRQYKYGNTISLLAYENCKLWLSDNKKISCYDAATMKLINETEWKGEEIKKAKMHADRNGHLWMSSYGAGLYCLDDDGNVLHLHKHESYDAYSALSDNITTIMEDRAGNLWLATDGAGLSIANLKEPSFGKFPLVESDHPELKDKLVWAIYEDRNGNTWFATNSGGLNILEAKTGKLRQIKTPGIEHVQSICRPTGRELWITYRGGVAYLQNERLVKVPLSTPKSFLASDGAPIAYKILGRGADTLVLATSAGPRMIVRTGNSWKEDISPLPPCLFKRATDIIATGNSDYWMACPGNGLVHFSIEAGGFKILDSFLYR